jgi:hypothetical protein
MPHPKAVWVPDQPYPSGTQEYYIGRIFDRETYNGYIDRIPRSQSMAYPNLMMYAGNDKEFFIIVKDGELAPVNLTGGSGTMTWKKTKSGPIVFQKVGVLGAPDNGEIDFYLVPTDTALLEPRQYVFDVTVTTSAGKKYTVLEGVLTLMQPVK